MRKIPKEIEWLYSELGRKVKTYTKLRWKLCPFELIAPILAIGVRKAYNTTLNKVWTFRG